MGFRKDLTGKKFGKLFVIEFDKSRTGYSYYWKCICECGKGCTVERDNLTSGNSKSCGCQLNLGKPTHGMSGRKHIIYSKWASMHQRCTNQKEDNFYLYGGRGIKVCNRWKKFENFRDDMLPTWKDGLTLERNNHNGNYTPENCRWATVKEQARNKRNNRFVKYKGEIKCVAEWAEEFSIPSSTVRRRIDSLKWSVEKALLTPVRKL